MLCGFSFIIIIIIIRIISLLFFLLSLLSLLSLNFEISIQRFEENKKGQLHSWKFLSRALQSWRHAVFVSSRTVE